MNPEDVLDQVWLVGRHGLPSSLEGDVGRWHGRVEQLGSSEVVWSLILTWFTWHVWWGLQLSRQSNGWVSVASCLSSVKRSLKKMLFCKTFLFQWIRSFCWNWNVLPKTCCVGKLPTIYLSPTPIERKWVVSSFCFPFQCFSHPVLPLVPTQGPSHKAHICWRSKYFCTRKCVRYSEYDEEEKVLLNKKERQNSCVTRVYQQPNKNSAYLF